MRRGLAESVRGCSPATCGDRVEYQQQESEPCGGLALLTPKRRKSMSAVLFRFMFPATCGSSLSWRLGRVRL